MDLRYLGSDVLFVSEDNSELAAKLQDLGRPISYSGAMDCPSLGSGRYIFRNLGTHHIFVCKRIIMQSWFYKFSVPGNRRRLILLRSR